MDDITRQRIEKRIAELEQQRMRRVMDVAAIDGAIAELRALLQPEKAKEQPQG